MSATATAITWALCVPVGALAVVEQLRAARLRARARLAGVGMVDAGTGLATIAAAELQWGSELAVAAASGEQIAVVAMRSYTRSATPVGHALQAAVRGHEVGVRIDHDACAAVLQVADADQAVLAAARLLDAVSAELDGDAPDVGIALSSSSARNGIVDLLDVVDDALDRLVPPARLRDVACALREAVPPT